MCAEKTLAIINVCTGVIRKEREYYMNKRKNEEAECIAYRNRITEIIGEIENKKILKRIYALAEYLYLYESME